MTETDSTIRSLKSAYRSGRDDLRLDFFEPCLDHCKDYARAAGYFRSSAFKSWGGALRRMASGDDIRVRLLVSPELSVSDFEALKLVADPADRQKLLGAHGDRMILDALEVDADAYSSDQLSQLLAWMIANEILEIKFAIPGHVDDPRMYHEKMGIFGFDNNDVVAFSGSANETYSGHTQNWEAVDVFRSWREGDRERVADKKHDFEEAWYGQAKGLRVVSLSQEAMGLIRAAAPELKPVVKVPRADQDSFTLRDYQGDAIREWEKNERHGLLEMCTGSGKTVIAIEAITRISESAEAGSVAVIACPTKVLVDQWDAEIKEKRPGWVRLKAYDSVADWSSRLPFFLNHGRDQTNAVITTYDSLFSPAFSGAIRTSANLSSDSILIADEAHWMSSESRLEAAEDVVPRFMSSLALTATPEIEGFPSRTEKLLALFEGCCFEFTLRQAIKKKVLCPYDYFPRPVFLDEEASAEFFEIEDQLIRASGSAGLKLYERKRALLRSSGNYLPEFEKILRETLLSEGVKPKLTVIYSPPGRESEDDDSRTVEKIKHCLETVHVGTSVITQGTVDRATALLNFRNGDCPVLLGIGCLDEGLDVPETERAVILYSVDRMKQFIQRRGRVLRKADHKNKTHAEIYDLIFLPQPALHPADKAEKILAKEIRRYREFASMARNKEEAESVLDNVLDGL